MIIDIIFAIVLLLAFIHGYKKGIIHSIVSLIALVIGIMAAVRLSELAAVYLDRWFNIASRYLPLISFILVFIGIYLCSGLSLDYIFIITYPFLNGTNTRCNCKLGWT